MLYSKKCWIKALCLPAARPAQSERERRIPPSKEHNRLSILIITSHRQIKISLITVCSSARLYSRCTHDVGRRAHRQELNSSGRSRRAIMVNYRKRQLIVRLAALALLEKVNTLLYKSYWPRRYYYFYIYILCVLPVRAERTAIKAKWDALRYNFFLHSIQHTAEAFNAFVFFCSTSDQGKRYKKRRAKIWSISISLWVYIEMHSAI